MSDLSITAANVAASNTAIIERRYPFGATVTQGQVVYLDSNNRWQLGDASAVTGNNVEDKRGVALVSGANGQPAVVCVKDTDFTPGATLSNGAVYAVSTNAGNIADIADITSGNYPVFVGIAKSTSKLNLNPTAAGIDID